MTLLSFIHKMSRQDLEDRQGTSIQIIQSLVEEPMIYMIAPSSSCPIHQLALVGDRVEYLQELSNPVSASNGIEIRDCLWFFLWRQTSAAI